MDAVTLAYSTGDERIDKALGDVISRVEHTFPAEIDGYYLIGSRATKGALPTSDIDMVIVFKGTQADRTIVDRAEMLVDEYARSHAINLGAFVMLEAAIWSVYNPVFKLDSAFLYGRDTRDALTLVPVEEWAQQVLHAMYQAAGRSRSLAVMINPLDPLAPQGEFYGYDRDTVRLVDGAEVTSTRGVVTGACWYATALVGLKAGQYVLRVSAGVKVRNVAGLSCTTSSAFIFSSSRRFWASNSAIAALVDTGSLVYLIAALWCRSKPALTLRKGDAPRLYRQHINDEWAPFLEEVYARCRREWGYHIPEDAHGRATLRALCGRYLAFENHFLTAYKGFVLATLRDGDDAAIRLTLDTMSSLPYQDHEIREGVRTLALAPHVDREIRRAAEGTLGVL